MNNVLRLGIFLLLLTAVFSLSLTPSKPMSASEAEEVEWVPFTIKPVDQSTMAKPNSGTGWLNIYVGKKTNAWIAPGYVASGECAGDAYVYWFRVVTVSGISNLGVWSINLINQLHINNNNGLHGHYACYSDNKCDVRLCTKHGWGANGNSLRLAK